MLLRVTYSVTYKSMTVVLISPQCFQTQQQWARGSVPYTEVSHSTSDLALEGRLPGAAAGPGNPDFETHVCSQLPWRLTSSSPGRQLTSPHCGHTLTHIHFLSSATSKAEQLFLQSKWEHSWRLLNLSSSEHKATRKEGCFLSFLPFTTAYRILHEQFVLQTLFLQMGPPLRKTCRLSSSTWQDTSWATTMKAPFTSRTYRTLESLWIFLSKPHVCPNSYHRAGKDQSFILLHNRAKTQACPTFTWWEHTFSRWPYLIIMNYSLVSLPPLPPVNVSISHLGGQGYLLLACSSAILGDASSFNANLPEEEVLEYLPVLYGKQNHLFCVVTDECPKGTSSLQLVPVTARTGQHPLQHKLMPMPLQQRPRRGLETKTKTQELAWCWSCRQGCFTDLSCSTCSRCKVCSTLPHHWRGIPQRARPREFNSEKAEKGCHRVNPCFFSLSTLFLPNSIHFACIQKNTDVN